MSHSPRDRPPRNHQTLILISFLRELGFSAELTDGQWVAQRTSGMLKRWIILPDDPAVPEKMVIASFWYQGQEMREELMDALTEFEGQMTVIRENAP